MRTLSSCSTLSLALLIVVLTGCPGSDETSNEATVRDAGGAGGTGSQGTAGESAGGKEDTPPKGGGGAGEGDFAGGSGGAGPAAGAGGSGDPAPSGGAGSGVGNQNDEGTDNDGCVGKFQKDAPWPAAGRCSARQGNAAAAGPQAFGALAFATLTSAIAASPVIDAAGNVYVVNARGLTKFDKTLAKKTELYTKGAISSAPVITDQNRVIALTESGDLVGVGVDGTATSAITYERAPNEATSGWTSSLALDAVGRLVFASPKGNVYVVNPTLETTDSVNLGAGVTVSGSSIAISTQGDLAIGTNKGLFVLPHGQTTTTQIAIAGAPVSRSAVFIPKGGKSEITAIYADDAGVVHNVVVKEDGKAADTPSKGAPPLGLSPGAPAVLTSGLVAKVFIGDGPLLRLLDTSDGPAVVDSKTIALSAAGPIVGAPATDSAGQLFVPSTDGNIYRLVKNPNDAAAFVIADSFLTEGAITTAPALAGNRLYFGSSDKKLYLITEAPVSGDPPAPGGP